MKNFSLNDLAYTFQIIAILLVIAYRDPVQKTESKADNQIKASVFSKHAVFSKPFMVFGIDTSWEDVESHRLYSLISKPFLTSK